MCRARAIWLAFSMLAVGAITVATLSPIASAQGRAAQQVTCQGEGATMVGTADDDVLIGTSKDDVIAGGGGNDKIHGAGGKDRLCGGTGTDSLHGGRGGDFLDGGGGQDRLNGGLDGDHLDGGPGSDQLFADAGNDRLDGGAGPDQIHGGSGDDHMDGGLGNDRLHGGTGLDLCWGGASTDIGVKCEAASIGISIAEALGKMAAQKLAGFVFNKIGLDDLLDPTTQRLAELKAELDRISQQLATLQTSVDQVSAELKALALQGFTIELTNVLSSIQSLYLDHYQPTHMQLEDYAKLKHEATEAGEPCEIPNPPSVPATPCGKARKAFEDERGRFVTNAQEAEKHNITLQNILIPNVPGGQSVMKAYGAYLMGGPDSTGFLTSFDSERLRSFFSYLAEWEALATLMKAEMLAIQWEETPALFDNFVNQQITGFQQKKLHALPDPIPVGTVIVLPVNPSARTTTTGRPMWLWDPKVGAQLRWCPGECPFTPRVTVPGAVTTFNTTAAGVGFTDWHVPSKAEYDSLFTGQTAYFAMDAQRFLGDNFAHDSFAKFALLTKFSDNPFLWTSATKAAVPATRQFCRRGGLRDDYYTLTNPAHTALTVPRGKTVRDYPSLPLAYVPGLGTDDLYPDLHLSYQQQLDWCNAELARLVTAAFSTYQPNGTLPSAQLLVTRTSTVAYMP